MSSAPFQKFKNRILTPAADPQGGTFQTRGGVNGRHYKVALEF